MSDERSVSELLRRLRQDPSDAARQLWDRFIERLIAAAHRNLRNLPRRALDEEDIAISAFASFIRGAADGRFQRLTGEEDLWQVLAMLVERKAIRGIRRELAKKRGKGQVRGESVFEKLIADSSTAMGIEQIVDPHRSAISAFSMGVRDMLAKLDDDALRSIAILKLEGYTNPEIAARQSISIRTVERRLSLIRKRWSNFADSD